MRNLFETAYYISNSECTQRRMKLPVDAAAMPSYGTNVQGGVCSLQSGDGFTLLELMVSFLIIAMMTTIVAGALRLGIRAVESGERRIAAIERFSSSVRIISAQIQSLNPLTKLEDEEKVFVFEGDGASISFASNYSIWGGEKGHVMVIYQVEEDEEGRVFLSASEHVIGLEEERETRLFDTLETARFEYFGHDPLEESGEWLDNWDDALTMPQKIRFSFSLNGDDYAFEFPIRAAATVSGGSIPLTGVPVTPDSSPEPEEGPDWRPPWTVR